VNLAKYDAACYAIQVAVAVDEVKDIKDKADAMRLYAHQAKNKALEVDAAEIRHRAERRLGEMISHQKETVGLATGGGDTSGGSREVPPHEPPTLAEAGIDKKLSARAQKLAAIPEEEFEETISDWREKVSQETERVTVNLIRAGERAQREENQHVPPPVGEYSLIYADPPWRYDYTKAESRAIENQYPTMTLDEICELDIPASNDCVLFMWATSPKLQESFDVLRAWGFTYKTCAVWDKEIIGMGYYFRQQHELLLVATKGQPGTPDESARISSVIKSRREKHSKKPDLVYEVLEGMYPDMNKIELFARNERSGWDGWGNG